MRKGFVMKRRGKRPLVKSLEESRILVLSHPMRRMVNLAATCKSAGPYRGGRHSDRPTLGAIIPTRQPTNCFAIVYPGRALFPGGDGETQCPKIRSDNVSDGSSLRSQAAIGLCSLSIA